MSEFVLLDTDVMSFLFKNSRYGDRFRSYIEGKKIVVSFATVAELYKWTIRRNWGPARIDSLVSMLETAATIPFSDKLAWRWAEVTTACERAGRPIDSMDAWIAATALHHGLPLLTHNFAHFQFAAGRCGFELLGENQGD